MRERQRLDMSSCELDRSILTEETGVGSGESGKRWESESAR